MNKTFFLLLCLLAAFANIYAQEGGEVPLEDEYTAKLAKNSFFVEAELLDGRFYTLNFDRIIIAKPKYKISTSIGGGISASLFASDSSSVTDRDTTNHGSLDPAINLSLNALFGGKRHKLETSLGILAGIGDYDTKSSIQTVTENNVQVVKYIPAREHTSLYITGRVGYRFQSDNGGLFIRVGVLPFVSLYAQQGSFKTYLGGTVGIGYTFKNKIPKESEQ
jgi:hypothetical protein